MAEPVKRLGGWSLRLLVFFLTITSAFGVHAAPVRYLSFIEVTQGLSSDETKTLRKHFEENPVIDLKASQFTELDTWIYQLTERLTKASEKMGKHFGTYRVFVCASEEWGFIYKYRPSGQNFFRGHVFLSTRLIEQFTRSLGHQSPNDFTDEELTQFMNGLIGIAAHEFAHPREDELVKWNVREQQSSFNRPHDQADEMADDLMAPRLLREGHLSPKNVLTGLELLFGYKPAKKSETKSEFRERMLAAAVKVHHEQKLRLSIVGGALVHDWIELGEAHEIPIPFDAARLKPELESLRQIATLKVSANPNPLLAAYEGFREVLETYPREERYTKYLDYIGHLMERRTLSDEEVDGFIELIAFLVQKHPGVLSGQSWLYLGFGSRDVPPIFSRKVGAPNIQTTRTIQARLKSMPVFTHPRFLAWFEKGKVDLSQILPFEGDEADFTSGFELLPRVLPFDLVSPLYTTARQSARSESRLDRARKDVEILYGNLSAKGPVRRDLQLLRSIRKHCEKSKKVSAAVAQVFEGLLVLPRAFFQERFILFDEKYPSEAGALLHEWALLVRHLLERPQLGFANTLGTSRHGEVQPYERISEILAWDMDRSAFPAHVGENSKLPLDRLHAYFLTVLDTEHWRKKIIGFVKTLPTDDYPWHSLMDMFLRGFALYKDFAFTIEQRIEFFEVAAGKNVLAQMGLAPSDERYIKSKAMLFHRIGNASPAKPHALANWYQEMGAEGLDGFFSRVLRAVDSKTIKDPVELFFEEDSDSFIQFLDIMRARGEIDEATWRAWVVKSLLAKSPSHLHENLYATNAATHLRLWRALRGQGILGIEFLKTLLGGFETTKNVASKRSIDRRDGRGRQNDDALAVQAKYNPEYFTVLSSLAEPLTGDFIKIVGEPPHSPKYLSAFESHFDQVLEFLHLVFCPGNPMASHFKRLYSTIRLDDLTPTFVSLIPTGITSEHAFLLWLQLAGSRSNQATDSFFETRVKPYWDSLTRSTQLTHAEYALKHGLFSSERLKVQYLREHFETRLAQLKHGQTLDDATIYRLVSDIQYLCPNSSRFRDEYLEEIAFDLKIGEMQLLKFIEPAKTFNYGAVDIKVLNLLSALTVFLESATPTERMSLVHYIRQPQGELAAAVPSMRKRLAQHTREMSENERRFFMENIQRLESFVRDAGETERHVLLQLLVGIAEHGLWHQGEKYQNELLGMLGIDPGTQMRVLFETHLQARPAFWHSILVSYLLSLRQEPGVPFDLVRVLEMFRAPGKKFADLAGVLGVFGPEYRHALLKMKGWTRIPSKATGFSWLRSIYSDTLYQSVDDIVRMLGGGANKVVALVKYDNGELEAVSIKRPYLKQTNASNIAVAKEWVANLRLREEYQNRYSYTFLLDLLESQLSMETDFLKELANLEELKPLYLKMRPIEGWSFGALTASKKRPQTDEILHFKAVPDLKAYEDLDESDRKAAAELILESELTMLFTHGIFEAERTTANYLFAPKERKVYPIDAPQVFRLERRGYLNEDDRTHFARLFQAIFDEDVERGAMRILETALAVRDGGEPLSPDAQTQAGDKIQSILKKDTQPPEKLAQAIGELHQAHIDLPTRYTLGVVKGLTILAKELYAQDAPKGLVENRIRGFVKQQAVRSTLSAPVQWVAQKCSWLLRTP